jgi:hypothetical protein
MQILDKLDQLDNDRKQGKVDPITYVKRNDQLLEEYFSL